MKLTDTFLRGLKASDKEQKHADGGGPPAWASLPPALWNRLFAKTQRR